MSAGSVSDHSHTICNSAASLLASSQHIAGYLALGCEVNVAALLSFCRAQGQHTYVPCVQDNHQMLFAPINESTRLVANRYGIKEPAMDAERCILATSLDAVLVPLVGFDNNCHRMGMGGGYYDRCFAHRRADAKNTSRAPLLIGVAYELQRTDSVLPDWWDVPLDYVVTEQRIFNACTT